MPFEIYCYSMKEIIEVSICKNCNICIRRIMQPWNAIASVIQSHEEKHVEEHVDFGHESDEKSTNEISENIPIFNPFSTHVPIMDKAGRKINDLHLYLKCNSSTGVIQTFC